MSIIRNIVTAFCYAVIPGLIVGLLMVLAPVSLLRPASS